MNIYVLGTSVSKFGELWNTSPRKLAYSVVQEVLEHSRIKATDIDVLYVGNMLSGVLGNQENLGSFFAEALQLFVPAIRIEAACASGGLSLHTAINSVKSGVYKTALVLGIEKMTDHTQEEVIKALMTAGSDEERSCGATFTGLYALIAQAYMDTYQETEESLAQIAVKNHYHGSLNDKAQFQSPITVADVMKSARIADPLKLLDCSPISDGAAALVITSDEKLAKKMNKSVKIVASEVATDTLSLDQRKSLVSLDAVVKASKKAYQEASLGPDDIDVAEVHDCFSIAEAIAMEDLGWSARGEGVKDIALGKTTLGKGKIVVNPSGGLKACGHPVGATGIKQVAELVSQLRKESGKRQVKGAKTALAHNVAGSGALAVIHILQAE